MSPIARSTARPERSAIAAVDPVKLRAWWACRQGLGGSLKGQTAERVLEQTGWVRSVGGSGPYLTLFARAGLSRSAVDAAVADLAIHELPSTRGCTYVVPAADFALALQVGRGEGQEAEVATAKRHLGVTDAELDRLCEGVLKHLDDAALDPAALKTALGDAVRNLGPEGKRRGLTTTLPLALGRLQGRGLIRRQPMNGRLDLQRFRYVRWQAPLPEARQPLAAAHAELARRYFQWIGPATLKQFQWFSGLGVAAARAATAELDLVPLVAGDDRVMLAADHAAWQAFTVPTEPYPLLVSGLDGLSHLRRDITGLIDEADAALPIWEALKGDSIADLAHQAIIDRGRLIGFWEYDPAVGEIVWATLHAPSPQVRSVIEQTTVFIREELGDIRFHSLDSPESRAPRLAALRRLAER